MPPPYEEELVAGNGFILGKGASGVTTLSKSLFTGKYYAVRAPPYPFSKGFYNRGSLSRWAYLS